MEAAVHAAREVFNESSSEALILVDAENAFNALNREAALNNINVICPELATYLLNTYREPAQLFISGSDEVILSEAGTTQGDPPAMGFYACGTMPIVLSGGTIVDNECVKQIWYADDSAAGGELNAIRSWWDNLCQTGPLFGYYPKPSKTWVICKPEYEEKAKAIFPDLNITSVGQRYLGSFIGTEQGKEDFIDRKVEEWCKDLHQLAEIASREPQIAYSAFVYGLSKRWNYVCRTTPRIAQRLIPLEQATRESFIPAILDRIFDCSDDVREIFTLPPRYGGLGIPNMMDMSDSEYEYSCRATKELKDAIVNQCSSYEEGEETVKAKASITQERNKFFQAKQGSIIEKLEGSGSKLMIQLATEKGASSWLTSLPLKEYGYVLNKQQFCDAIAIRYNLTLKDCPKVCACGQKYSVNHALICKLGGYSSMRHNWLRDTIGKIMKSVKCKDVQIEPWLLPVDGQHLPSGTELGDQARLDISARSVWNVLERAFFDVRVFHAPAPTYTSKEIPAMYLSNENEKKRKYLQRIIQIERGTFTPVVYSTTGGMGLEAQRLVKKLAQKMAITNGQRYADSISYIRRRLRFELLKTTVIALRGDRGSKLRQQSDIEVESLDLNLEPVG